MNKPVKWDAAGWIEQIYQDAEIKAHAKRDFSSEAELWRTKSSHAPTPDPRLLAAAKCELERRAVRLRHLPMELSADTGWAVLLDLFINGTRPSSVDAAQCCCGRNLSPATFARLIAALIEEGLLVRVFAEDNGETPAKIRLSHYGQEQVCKVLRHI